MNLRRELHMSTMFWIWLAVIVITAIVEAATTDLVSIWFTFGAVIPFIFAAIDIISPVWQAVIFIIVSAVLIATLRRTTLKLLFKNDKDTKTNADAIIGQKHRMLESTNFETNGKIKIKGVDWSVKGENQQTINQGQIVEVVKIEGNKLIVKPCQEENKSQQKK